MTPKAISFTPEVLKAKLRALDEYGTCQTRRPVLPHPPPGNGTERWTFCVSSTDRRSVDRFTLAQMDPSGNLYTERGRETVLASPKSPFGLSGQRLWIRERARVVEFNGLGGWVRLRYALDNVLSGMIAYPTRLRTPTVGNCIPNGVHREGARHFLEVVGVRAESVAEISEEDALLEGIERYGSRQSDGAPLFGLHGSGRINFPSARAAYFALYDSIYGAGAHARDWCWVYTLKRAA